MSTDFRRRSRRIVEQQRAMVNFLLVISAITVADAAPVDHDVCGSCNVDYSSEGGAACCDAAFSSNALACAEVEEQWGWDCSGCVCPSPPECIDCAGRDCSTTIGQLGDGSCDDPFDCLEYGFDAGDCGTTACLQCDVRYTSSTTSSTGTASDGGEDDEFADKEMCCDVAVAITGLSCVELEVNAGYDCTGCECPDPPAPTTCAGDNYPAYASWIGDGICDFGRWGVNFNCSAFNFDGGDCLLDSAFDALKNCVENGQSLQEYLETSITFAPTGLDSTALCDCVQGVYCSDDGAAADDDSSSSSSSSGSSNNNKPDVYALDLSNKGLQGTIPPRLCSLTHVQALHLEENNLWGPVPACLSSLNKLTQLFIGGNLLSSTLPASIGSIETLVALHLEGGALTGTLPAALGSLRKLTSFIAWSNFFSGSIPSSVGSLSALEYLEIDGQSLTGTLPPSLGSLPLKILEVYTNQLTGSIPPALGSLSAVSFFKLYDNALTGTAPLSLCSLTSAWELYVYHNDLDGTLSPCLGSLSSLEKLGFYDTDIYGTIPVSCCCCWCWC